MRTEMPLMRSVSLYNVRCLGNGLCLEYFIGELKTVLDTYSVLCPRTDITTKVDKLRTYISPKYDNLRD